MARIRFTQPERATLLARAVLVATADAAEQGAAEPLDHLALLAAAADAGDGKGFDELLVEHFRDVALAALNSQADE